MKAGTLKSTSNARLKNGMQAEETYICEKSKETCEKRPVKRDL